MVHSNFAELSQVMALNEKEASEDKYLEFNQALTAFDHDGSRDFLADIIA